MNNFWCFHLDNQKTGMYISYKISNNKWNYYNKELEKDVLISDNF